MAKSTTRGRPRNFDTENALQNALQIFLEKGYEGASLDDLTQAMGISRPSLYAAFGNKEQLFLSALATYADPSYEAMERCLSKEGASVGEAFLSLFSWFIESHTCQKQMQGCLVVNSTILCSENNAATAEQLKTIALRQQHLFERRLTQAKTDGELDSSVDTLAIAQYFVALIQGLSVMARQQNSPTLLKNAAQMGLKMLSHQELKTS